MNIPIRIEFSDDLPATHYFDDWPTEGHADATEDECAAEVARFIENNGLRMFLADWNLDDFDVWVGSVQVVRDGLVVTEASNQESRPE